jgi:hypothetical protein
VSGRRDADQPSLLSPALRRDGADVLVQMICPRVLARCAYSAVREIGSGASRNGPSGIPRGGHPLYVLPGGSNVGSVRIRQPYASMRTVGLPMCVRRIPVCQGFLTHCAVGSRHEAVPVGTRWARLDSGTGPSIRRSGLRTPSSRRRPSVSFGGYLAPRAAAFEPRIGAVVTIDGLFDAHQAVLNLLTTELQALLDQEDSDGFNAAIHAAMDQDSGLPWYIQHGMWCFRVPTPYDFFVAARPYTLEEVAQRIACPVLVCAAADDHLNPGQAENLAAALGNRATLRTFTAQESAGSHSHPGASMLLNGVVFDWLAEALNTQAAAVHGYVDGALDQAQAEHR